MLERTMIAIMLLLPVVGGAMSYFIGRHSEKYRDYFNILLTGAILMLVSLLYPIINKGMIQFHYQYIMGTGLYIKIDFIRYILLWMTAFIWFLTTIYSTQYLIRYKNRNRYYTFFIWTLAATMGVFLSNHLLNILTFFELMSFASYVLVIHDEDENAHAASKTYLTMAVMGGLSLLMGIFLVFQTVGTLYLPDVVQNIGTIGSQRYPVSILLILGFGVKAGMVPLHIWLPKAHAAAPTPASAILSGVLVKTGIFGIYTTLSTFLPQDVYIHTVLLVLGFITMILGGVIGIFQINAKRILAYSTLSQMGYIIIGLGMIGLLKENGSAIVGTILHIINHMLFKVVLFMSIGIIYMMTHELNINRLKGIGKSSILCAMFFLIGFLGLTGMPGFNGFVSKTLLHEALTQLHHQYGGGVFYFAEILFTLGGALTVAYSLKLFTALFLDKEVHHHTFEKHLFNYKKIVPLMILSGLILWIGTHSDFVIKEIILRTGLQGQYQHHFYLTDVHLLQSAGITFGLGIAIYLLVIKGVLERKDNQQRFYIHIPKYFCLERTIYAPIGSKIFKIFHQIFHHIDYSILWLYRVTLSFFQQLLELKLDIPDLQKIQDIKIGVPNLEKRRNRKVNIPKIKNVEERKVEFTKEKLSNGNRARWKKNIFEGQQSLNSVSGSLFIFVGSIVAIFLGILFSAF